MEQVVFHAKHRDVIGKQVKTLRRDGYLPAVLYGRKIDPIPISLDYREASKILPQITSSQLVIVDVDGDQHHTLVREKQRNPVKSTLLHVDFMVVSMTEKLRASVTIDFAGESPAVKELSAVLVIGQEDLEVESLPKNMPERIIVDLSNLTEFGDALFVKDIVIPADVDVITDLEEMVVMVTFPAAEIEEEEEVVEELEEEPEVIERGKREEEEEVVVEEDTEES